MSRLIDQKGLIYFQQRFIKTTTFPTSFGLERGLVVHLVVGIHVANVAVVDQVHVTKFSNSTKRKLSSTGVTCVNLTNLDQLNLN